jgi:hypothetical protein
MIKHHRNPGRVAALPQSALEASAAQNVGAAAVLASHARRLDSGKLPVTLAGWYGAVAAYSGAITRQAAQLFANEVFSVIRSGVALVTTDHQAMRIAAHPGLRPDTRMIGRLGLKAVAAATAAPDCPASLRCRYIPAPYAEEPGNNPDNYGTNAEYESDAALVRYMAARYGVPLDREHIVGHDNVGGPTNADNAVQHWDPGPFWNWNYFMSLVLHEPEARYITQQGAKGIYNNHHIVTIIPNFATSKPKVTDCQTGTCVTLPRQPASFVYLHTRPSASSPRLSDPTLHPDGSPGTTKDSNWSDKAPAGEQYVLAGRHGDWTGIWFGGQVG